MASHQNDEQNVYYLPTHPSPRPIPEVELERYATTVAEWIAETRTPTKLGEGACFLPEFIAQAEANGWSEARMAAAIRVSPTTIWRYNPRRRPKPTKIRRKRRSPDLCKRVRHFAAEIEARPNKREYPVSVSAEAVALANEYERAGFSLRRLARDVGLNPSTLSHWRAAAGQAPRDPGPLPRSETVPPSRGRPAPTTAAPPSTSSPPAECVISYRGATVETADPRVAAKLLRELLKD